jgi:hypothetical protein
MVVVAAGTPLSAAEWAKVCPEDFDDPGLAKAPKVLERSRKDSVTLPREMPAPRLDAIEAAIKTLTAARNDLKTLAGALDGVVTAAGSAGAALKKGLKTRKYKAKKAYEDALWTAEGMQMSAKGAAAGLR